MYYKLTTQQANIWNLQKYYEGTSISNLCGAIIYDESRDLTSLQQAIYTVIDNNESLRLRFSENGEVAQYLADCGAPIEVKAFKSESELDIYAESIARTPMSMTDSQMCFFTVFSLGNRSGVLAKMNHLIADAWSFGLIADKIEDAYQETKSSSSAEGYLQYINKDVEYKNSEKFRKDKFFWEERYQTCPERASLLLTESSSLSGTEAISADRIVKQMPADIYDSIVAYCHNHGVSEAVLFESAVLLYLYRTNPNNKSITIGLPVLNRKYLSEKRTTGMFISTIPLTVFAEKTDSISSFLEKVSTSQHAVFRHQRYPYAEILKDLRKTHSFIGNLYDVMVSVQNTKINKLNHFNTKWYANGYSEVPLVVSIDQRDGQSYYTVTLDYQKRLFVDKNEAELFFERIICVLKEIAEESNKSISSINILSEKEERLLLKSFNDTFVQYHQEKCVHELFEEQAEKTPDRIALIFRDRQFTYKEIDEMSNSLAWYLRALGVCRNEIIPIIAQRDWRIVVAMLGVLKAGGAYMPVSPEYPDSRIKTMLGIVKCKRALCYGYDRDIPVERIDLSEFEFEQKQLPIENSNEQDDLCYIIFTSGSTGMPKGCCIKHRNFANTLLWRKEQYSNGIKDIICTSSIFTDTFGEDVFSNLISNNTIHLVCDNQNLYAVKDEFESSITGKNCLMTTPTFFSAIMDSMKSAKWTDVTLVGEQLTRDIVDKYAANFETLHNEYGPSECSVCASYKKIGINDFTITIGRPIANTQVYVLDDRQNLLPIGVAGELCIAGTGVGQGYLNRPDLTAERFIPNPFATEKNGHGKVLYRTGDLARWRLDGEIEYLGRIDTQVKIRGLRIELGEIESVMAEMEGIGLVAAAAQKDDSGRQYLVGYYTSNVEIDEKDLRKRLTMKLPKYMVPNYFMRLNAMPMTASGKTDRKNLPVPDMSGETRDYVAPATETEIKLCRLMEDILSIERIGTQDDFFELGGDSLKAISFVAMAHEAGIEISLQAIYDHATVQELCEYLKAQASGDMAMQVSGVSDLHSEDYENYHCLLRESVIGESLVFDKKSLGNVFLTGATGFLGAHILDALMKHENGLVYCLVRGETNDEAREHLAETLQWYFGGRYRNEIGRKIIPVRGAVEQDNLSDDLPEDVRTVIHAAALVKHFGKYEIFHKVNVEGTENVTKYAERVNAQLIHISTASVSGNALSGNNSSTPEEVIDFSETDYFIGQSLENVYVRSKFEAERVVMDAIRDGRLTARIVRIGNLTNRTGDYRFQPNYESNAFLRRMKALIELGAFPEYLLPYDTEFSPVDLTAEGIIKIAQYADKQIVFHLFNDQLVSNVRLVSMLRDEGISMEVVSDAKFREAIEATIGDPHRSHIYEALETVMDQNDRIVPGNSIHVNTRFTDRFLSKTGFRWREIDKSYLVGYISYFKEVGYLNV